MNPLEIETWERTEYRSELDEIEAQLAKHWQGEEDRLQALREPESVEFALAEW